MVHFINALIIVLLLGLSTLLGKAQTKNANADFDHIILNAYHQDQANRSSVEKVFQSWASTKPIK